MEQIIFVSSSHFYFYIKWYIIISIYYKYVQGSKYIWSKLSYQRFEKLTPEWQISLANSNKTLEIIVRHLNEKRSSSLHLSDVLWNSSRLIAKSNFNHLFALTYWRVMQKYLLKKGLGLSDLKYDYGMQIIDSN